MRQISETRSTKTLEEVVFDLAEKWMRFNHDFYPDMSWFVATSNPTIAVSEQELERVNFLMFPDYGPETVTIRADDVIVREGEDFVSYARLTVTNGWYHRLDRAVWKDDERFMKFGKREEFGNGNYCIISGVKDDNRAILSRELYIKTEEEHQPQKMRILYLGSQDSWKGLMERLGFLGGFEIDHQYFSNWKYDGDKVAETIDIAKGAGSPYTHVLFQEEPYRDEPLVLKMLLGQPPSKSDEVIAEIGKFDSTLRLILLPGFMSEWRKLTPKEGRGIRVFGLGSDIRWLRQDPEYFFPGLGIKSYHVPKLLEEQLKTSEEQRRISPTSESEGARREGIRETYNSIVRWFSKLMSSRH